MQYVKLCQRIETNFAYRMSHTSDSVCYVSIFTIFPSLRHKHTVFVSVVHTHRIFFVLARSVPFRYYFFFFFRARSLFIYLLFASLYLFSVLENHNASINRESNWNCWQVSHKSTDSFACQKDVHRERACFFPSFFVRRVFVYFLDAIRLENTHRCVAVWVSECFVCRINGAAAVYGCSVCLRSLVVATQNVHSSSVKMPYSPLRECAHWQPFGFSSGIAAKTERNITFSINWMQSLRSELWQIISS